MNDSLYSIGDVIRFAELPEIEEYLKKEKNKSSKWVRSMRLAAGKVFTVRSIQGSQASFEGDEDIIFFDKGANLRFVFPMELFREVNPVQPIFGVQ